MCGNETSESESLEKDFVELENQSFISVMELIGSFHQPTFRQKLVKKIEQQKTSFETPSNYDANQWATVWTSSRFYNDTHIDDGGRLIHKTEVV